MPSSLRRRPRDASGGREYHQGPLRRDGSSDVDSRRGSAAKRNDRPEADSEADGVRGRE